MSTPSSLRVMTFNLWWGGQPGGQPLEQTAEVIRAAKADIIGLQETHPKTLLTVMSDRYLPSAVRNLLGMNTESVAPKLAEMLGFHVYDQTSEPKMTAILSRYPIIGTIDTNLGVIVQLPCGKKVHHINVHMAHAPYQPYQLLKIPYEGRFIDTEQEAIEEAEKVRGKESDRVVREVQKLLAENATVFITGDFNEPSHLDWTPQAAAANLCPIAVQWPATQKIVQAGMTDAFRAVYADEVQTPGLTWTSLKENPKERHDRIDFVFASKNVHVETAEIVGEEKGYADIVVTPYPSDHRSVVAQVTLQENVSVTQS
eukprot:GDKI01034287.1.p1 GENE.GDKI01034287.1~~GDKI01034287.1.p1  ORF type:complete len:355 (-),score=67.79 GDKI01034287.1:335-1276(-)